MRERILASWIFNGQPRGPRYQPSDSSRLPRGLFLVHPRLSDLLYGAAFDRVKDQRPRLATNSKWQATRHGRWHRLHAQLEQARVRSGQLSQHIHLSRGRNARELSNKLAAYATANTSHTLHAHNAQHQNTGARNSVCMRIDFVQVLFGKGHHAYHHQVDHCKHAKSASLRSIFLRAHQTLERRISLRFTGAY